MLGLGLSLQRLRAVGDFFSFLFRRIREDGGTVEAQKCATEEGEYAKKSAGDNPTLAMIPSGYKGEGDENNSGGFLGKVYSVLPAQTTSDNLVTNGTFDTDSDWTKIGVVNISNGVATLDGDGQTTICYQSNIIEEGKNYTATFEILNYNGLGEGRIIDDTGAPYYTITQDGVFTISFKAKVHSTGVFYFRARN